MDCFALLLVPVGLTLQVWSNTGLVRWACNNVGISESLEWCLCESW